MKAIKFRAAYGYDTDAASTESSIDFTGQQSLTVQSMAEDADINVIIARFGITGKMPENPVMPMYGDFTDVMDYRTALHAVMDASDKFMDLPAKVRARFNNDPQELMEFIANDDNIEEAQRLGLLTEKTNDTGRSTGTGGSMSSPNGPPPAPGGTTELSTEGRQAVTGGSPKAPREQ